MLKIASERTVAIVLLFAVFASGCAAPIKPEDLAVPKQVTCIDLKQPIVASGVYGIGYTWITRLERGPYWSEREDENGTYYRAPPGGYSVKSPEGGGAPGFQSSMDGGFYLPKDPNVQPRLYRYFSAAPAQVVVPLEDANCTNLQYVMDPATSRVSLWSFAAGGAVGGATGGLVGRSLSQNSSISYGQAAGAGAVSGMAAGLIVAALINADVGKITPGLLVKDPQFFEQLKAYAASAVPIKHLASPVVAADASTPAADPSKPQLGSE